MNISFWKASGRVAPWSVFMTATAVFAGIFALQAIPLHAQQITTDSALDDDEEEDEPVVLSPFVVDSTQDRGYAATSTLAGTRIRTDLADIGSSISVITPEMLRDLGAKNNETILAYALNTEVGGVYGNFSGGVSQGASIRETNLFANPNANTRVRGLSSADNTRNYFITDVPWDGYIVNRVDLLRGPNAILFGLGSPAGVINATTNTATFSNRGRAEVTIDQFGSRRYILDYNHELLEDELAFRFSALKDDHKFRQKPAFSDDERLYGAVKYKPDFLNKNGVRVEVSGNYEYGKIRSNRPRTVTPTDQFTQFWDPESAGGVNKRTVNYYRDGLLINSDEPTHIHSLGSSFSSGVQLQVNSNNPDAWFLSGIDAFGGRTPTGDIITNKPGATVPGFIYGDNFGQQIIAATSNWAISSQQPFAPEGFWKNKSLSDPSVFDFYNKLIDGPNKAEWTNWDVFEVGLTNTFLNDRVGYDITFFKQKLDRGMAGPLGWQNRIFMDINENLADFTPNQNVGRAYVEEYLAEGSSGTTRLDRDSARVQLFGEYDFAEKRDGWLSRLIGMHRLTGVYSEEGLTSDSRTIKLYGVGPEFLSQHDGTGMIGSGPQPTFRYYLSDDLRDRSSAAGSNLSNMGMSFLPGPGTQARLKYFDTTWIAPDSVGFNDPWLPNVGYMADPSVEGGFRPRGDAFQTQSANPANYRGWTTKDVPLLSMFGGAQVAGMSERDYLTRSATLSTFDVESKVLVWQGHLWDRAIVGVYGYREDSAVNYTLGSDNNRPDQGARVEPSYFNLQNPDGRIEKLDTVTRNWSVAVHLNKLLGKRDFLPLNVSLYYNEGENFQPLAGRLDDFGQVLEPPGGQTKEYSVLIATKDNKYSLRATKYETISNNQTLTANIDGMWALEQTIFSPVWSRGQFENGTWDASGHPDPDRLNNVIIPAWRQFEADLKSQFPEFIAAWVTGPWPGIPFATTAQRPQNANYTEDAVSKGLEFEFVANPTDNWRIGANASRTVATRDNVPGEAFLSLASFVDDKIMNTPVGEMPVWWNASPGVRENIYVPNFRPGYIKLLALNGQTQGELRKWRGNLFTNYSFTEGALKGFGVGGGYRYESRNVIDYKPKTDEDGIVQLDLDAPIYGPKETTFDLWLSYERRLSKAINWRIQLNVYNAFGDNELIPLNAQPNGMPAAYRIKEGQSWQLTNAFEF